MADSNTSTDTGTCGDSALPLSPFRSLNPHFGMLMGVDDFQLLQSYARGKMWLHNAWLHGAGAVWGLGVSIDDDGRLTVSAGFALDACGRELYLAADACLDIAAWLREHQDDPVVAKALEKAEGDAFSMDAHVVIAHRACPERQVPALREPCEGESGATAYSRMHESVELKLVPGAYELPEDSGDFHRLRVLFGLEPPAEGEDELVEALNTVATAPSGEQSAERLRQMRRLAALDSVELGPGDETGPYPSGDSTALPLAALNGVQFEQNDDGSWVFEQIDEIDLGIRPVVLPTRLIQELTASCGCDGGAPGPAAESLINDAGGPRILPETVELAGDLVRMRADRPVSEQSVSMAAMQVLSYKNSDGWSDAKIIDTDYNDNTFELSAKLSEPPQGNLVRIIVKGTGAMPVVGTDEVPLAGGVGGPPCDDPSDGCDFVHMYKKEG